MNTDTRPSRSLELRQQHLADFPPPTLVDVRREEAFARDRHVIAGAIQRVPEAVSEWAIEHRFVAPGRRRIA